MIIAHPLQIMRIVSASFKSSGIPGPKALALGAEHLVAALSLVNENLAIRAGFSVVLQKSDRSDGVWIANVQRIIASGLEFPAMRTRVLVAGSTLPSGSNESVAVGISTSVNELCGRVPMILWRPMTLQLNLGVRQICLESLKLLDLCQNVLDLCVNALDDAVMRDGSLSGR